MRWPDQVYKASIVDQIQKGDAQKRQGESSMREKIHLPSVMLFQPRNRTPTAAVSSKVATKEPSTLELEPYKEKERNIRKFMSAVNRKKCKSPCRSRDPAETKQAEIVQIGM